MIRFTAVALVLVLTFVVAGGRSTGPVAAEETALSPLATQDLSLDQAQIVLTAQLLVP